MASLWEDLVRRINMGMDCPVEDRTFHGAARMFCVDTGGLLYYSYNKAILRLNLNIQIFQEGR
jgi:hypothetical protein